MRIAVLRPQVPFARGGAEIFTDELVEELRGAGSRGRPRLGAVQVVSGRPRADAGVPLAAARPRGGGRAARSTSSSRRSSPRTSSATARSASGSCTSSARRTSSTAPTSGSSASRPRIGRCAGRCRSSTGVALGEATRLFATSRERRGAARALDRARRRGAAAPAAGAALPQRPIARASSCRRAGSTGPSGSTCCSRRAALEPGFDVVVVVRRARPRAARGLAPTPAGSTAASGSRGG